MWFLLIAAEEKAVTPSTQQGVLIAISMVVVTVVPVLIYFLMKLVKDERKERQELIAFAGKNADNFTSLTVKLQLEMERGRTTFESAMREAHDAHKEDRSVFREAISLLTGKVDDVADNLKTIGNELHRGIQEIQGKPKLRNQKREPEPREADDERH